MTKRVLSELISDVITGEWGNDSNETSFIKVLRTTNFTNEGKLDLAKGVVVRDIDLKKYNKKKLNYGDVIIEKSGGSPRQPVGRVVYFDITEGGYVCNNFTSIIRPKNGVESKYLLYAMYYLHATGRTLKYQNKTTGIINLKLENYLNAESVFVPELQIQRKIVACLDAADTLTQKRKEAIAKLDELVQSVFVDMFGDLQKNSKKWDKAELKNLADLSSGVTKGKKYKETNLVSVPYMRVANVQDGYLNLTEIKDIEVSESDTSRYKLLKNDILLTEGGDPDKLGRGAVWNEEIPNCIHQNHIFRVRVNPELLNPYFLCACTGSDFGKKYFLKMAKQTTGIATINMTQLRSFPVYVPPVNLQNKFEQRIKMIETQKQRMNRQLLKLENNFQSLLHHAFTGRLKFREEKVTEYAVEC